MSAYTRPLLPVAWMALLWGLSSLPSAAEHELAGVLIEPMLQNAAHVVAYGVLAAAWFWALSPRVLRASIWSIGLTTGYGIVDELHQAFVPGRTSSAWDLALDAAGAAVALAVLKSTLRAQAPSVAPADG